MGVSPERTIIITVMLVGPPIMVRCGNSRDKEVIKRAGIRIENDDEVFSLGPIERTEACEYSSSVTSGFQPLNQTGPRGKISVEGLERFRDGTKNLVGIGGGRHHV